MERRSNEQLARDLFRAYVANDRQAAEALIAAEFHFTSPFDNRLDRKSYFEICWPNSGQIRAVDIEHAAAEGDRVYVTYTGETSAGKRFRNTERFTCRNGQIIEVEVYFGWSVPHPVAPGRHSAPDVADLEQ